MREQRGPSAKSHSWEQGLTVGILILAGFLRFWNIGASLPHIYDSGDEAVITANALRVGSGKLNPRFYVWPGSTLTYLNTAAYGVFFVVGYLGGSFDGPDEFAVSFLRDPTPWYLISRTLVALFGVVSVWALIAIGRVAFDRRTGLTAGLFLAVTLGHVELSRKSLPDVPAICLMLVSCLFCILILKDPKRSYYRWAGLVLGLSLATKYYTGLMILTFVAVHLRVWKRLPTSGRVRLVGRRSASYFVALVLGFVVGCPFFLLDIREALSQISFMFDKGAGSVLNSDQWSYGFLVGKILPEMMGYPLLVLAAVGFVVAIVIERRRALPIALFTACHFVFVGTWTAGSSMTHYVQPMVPFAALFAAVGVNHLISRLTDSGGMPRVIGVLVVGAVAAWPAVSVARWVQWSGRDDTRTIAKRWIEENIPYDSRIVIDGGRLLITQSPPLAESKDSIRERLEKLEEETQPGFKASEAMFYRSGLGRYLKLRLRAAPEQGYYLSSTFIGRNAKPLEYYVESGFQYAVVNADVARRYSEPELREAYPDSYEYYTRLRLEGRLIKAFERNPEERPGPTVLVYRLPGE